MNLTKLTIISIIFSSVFSHKSNQSFADMPIMGQLKQNLHNQLHDVDQDFRQIKISDIPDHFQGIPDQMHQKIHEDFVPMHQNLHQQLKNNFANVEYDIPHTNGIKIKFGNGSNVFFNRVSEKSEAAYKAAALVVGVFTLGLTF